MVLPVAASMKGRYTRLGACATPAAMCEAGTRHIMECLFFIRLRATYSWPWANISFRESSPMRYRVCPWIVFIVREYARRREN